MCLVNPVVSRYFREFLVTTTSSEMTKVYIDTSLSFQISSISRADFSYIITFSASVMGQGNCYIYYKCCFYTLYRWALYYYYYYYYYYYGRRLLCCTDVLVLLRYVGLHFDKSFISVASVAPPRNVCSVVKKKGVLKGIYIFAVLLALCVSFLSKCSTTQWYGAFFLPYLGLPCTSKSERQNPLVIRVWRLRRSITT
jgi:hypothetical protein